MSKDARVMQETHRRQILAISATATVLVVGLGGWAATTEFAGAVMAPGQVVVNANVKKVQHPTGGTVGELLIRDGDRVKGGDVVLRLDDTQTRANLALVSKALDELAARRARQEAERDGLDAVAFPQALLDRLSDPDVAKAVHGELQQFDSRRRARGGERSQLRQRIVQLTEEVRGHEAQIASKSNRVVRINKQLKVERDKGRLEGKRRQLIAAIAQTKGKITETELQMLQIEQDMRTEVDKHLADIRAKTAELVEKKVAAEDMLKRADIRAPRDGVVHHLAVHTVRGVIGPRDVIMLIVPESDALEIEARIEPQNIDQVRVGQRAVMHFSVFNRRTTLKLKGEVTSLSADVSEDPKTGARYYTARIALPQSEIDRLGALKPVPGMPVESFIQTSPRTVISYLLKPLQVLASLLITFDAGGRG